MGSARTKLPRSQAAVLLLACVLTYANAVGGGFTYDDKAIVRDNPRIQTPANFPKIFTTTYFGGPRGSGTAYRPVLLVSYAVQWWIHGRQAAAFHAVNILLHACATLLFASLLLRIRIAPAAAFAAALLFAVHPLEVEAVASLVGRGEVLASVFALLYLRLALSVFESRPARIVSLAAALGCFALSVLTKESGSSAPALAFLLFVYVAEGSLSGRLRSAFVRGLPVLAGSAATLVGVLFVRRWALGGFLKPPDYGIFEVENALAHVGPGTRAVNACVILFRYLGRFVLPLHLSGDESAWSIRVVAPGSPVAIAAVLLLAALAVAALRRLSSRSPLALGFLFFCLALLPASNLLFFTGTIFAERIAYLPSAGLCLAAGALLAGTAPALSALAPSRRKLLAAVALLLAARTVVRNAVWWSDEGLFLNLVRTAPDSAKAHYDIAYIWAGERQYARARGEYATATAIYDGYWDAWAGKGRMELDLRLYDAAEKSYRKAIDANDDYENGYFGLGLVREARGNLAGAEEIYREGLARKADSLPLAYRLALMRSRLGWPAAVPDWKRALALGPETPAVHADYAKWLTPDGGPVGGSGERSPGDSAPRASRSEFPPPPGGARQVVRLPVRRGPRAREDLPPLSLGGRLEAPARRRAGERGLREAAGGPEEFAAGAGESPSQGPRVLSRRTGWFLGGALRREVFLHAQRVCVAALGGANGDPGMAAVIDPKDREEEHVGRQPDGDRDDGRADEEREKTRREGRPLEGVPEVAVEQPVPGQPRHAPAVVVQDPSAEPVTERVDGGKRPRIPRELAERGVDLVQAKNEGEAERDPDVETDERRKPDGDPHGDRRRDALGRLFAAEQVEHEHLPSAFPGQRMKTAAGEGPGETEELLHARPAKWSCPRPEISRSPSGPRRTAPRPGSR